MKRLVLLGFFFFYSSYFLLLIIQKVQTIFFFKMRKVRGHSGQRALTRSKGPVFKALTEHMVVHGHEYKLLSRTAKETAPNAKGGNLACPAAWWSSTIL